jgi:hypothetical protein
MNDVINDRITAMIDALFPDGEGRVGRARVETALKSVAQVAFREGESGVLLSLLTVEDVAAQLGVNVQRVRAIAKVKHERFGIGWKVPGSRGTWLFLPREVELLRPGAPGRPRSARTDE